MLESLSIRAANTGSVGVSISSVVTDGNERGGGGTAGAGISNTGRAACTGIGVTVGAAIVTVDSTMAFAVLSASKLWLAASPALPGAARIGGITAAFEPAVLGAAKAWSGKIQ